VLHCALLQLLQPVAMFVFLVARLGRIVSTKSQLELTSLINLVKDRS